MGKVGEMEVYTPSGWLTIELYDPADFSYTPIEVRVGSNQWGCPFVTDPANADTPLEVYTQSGWKGISQLGYQIIEDWEDGISSAWKDGNDSDPFFTTTRASWQGTYGIRSPGDNVITADPTYDVTLDYYPQPGDTFEFFVKYADTTSLGKNCQFWYAIQDPAPSSVWGNYGTGYVDDLYWVRVSKDFSTGTCNYRMAKDSGGTFVELDHHVGSADDEEMFLDTWYRFEVDWEDSTAGTTTWRVYEQQSGGGERLLVTLSHTDTEFSLQGGVGIRAFGTVDLDYLKTAETP